MCLGDYCTQRCDGFGHLARVMGTSLREVDRTYGHLVRDSEASIVAVLEARSALTTDAGRTEGCP